MTGVLALNYVFRVEEFIHRVEIQGYQPGEDEVKTIGEILGQPTRKLSVVYERYYYIMRNYIEKKCTEIDNKSICLYTWRHGVPFRLFPLALHAYGTILLFEDIRPTTTIAFPMNKALSYAKSPGLSIEEYGDRVPLDASIRVDGWHLTAYFNPLLNRWIFATRYALHNMYYMRNRLVIESIDSISNPYVVLADQIAERDGLYSKLDKYRGWTFTFVLEGPEPAITKPPYPIGADLDKYRLYLALARSPDGRLLTWSETSRLIDYPSVPHYPVKSLRELYEEIRFSLTNRSIFAYIDTGDPVNPVIAELESDLYPDAMNTIYLNDAKSAGILVCEGRAKELASILGDTRGEFVLRLDQVRAELESVLNRAIESMNIDLVAKSLDKILGETGVKGLSHGEIKKLLEERNTKRLVKKLLALVLNSRSILDDTTLKDTHEIIKKLAKAVKLTE